MSVSGCQATKGAHTTSGQYLGAESKKSITIEETKLSLPTYLKTRLNKIVAIDVGVNRYSEKLYGNDYYFRMEQLYRGYFDTRGQGNLLTFAKKIKDDDGSTIPVDTIQFTKKNSIKYGTFTSNSNKPCLLVRLAIGKATDAKKSDAIINGVICGNPGDNLDKTIAEILPEIAKIKMF